MNKLGRVALIVAACAVSAAHADEVFFNANVYTMDPANARARAIAVRGGRVLRVGAEADVLAAVGADAARRDLNGQTVLPGFIDAHGHLLNLGRFGLGRLDLSGARSFDELCAQVAVAAATTGSSGWMLGGRWDHESWPGKQLPTNTKLNQILPNTPVWLKRVDGHAGLANAAALKRAGITRDTASPPGGEILRDARGEPTGLLVDRAMELIEKHLPDASKETAAALLKAQEMCFAAGLTGVHDAGVSPDELAIYQSLADADKLKLRVHAMVNGADAAEYFRRRAPAGGDRLSIRAAKFYADGALGSRGANLLAPYSDRSRDEHGHAYTGLTITSEEALEKAAKDALIGGYQMCVHAIGDAANRAVLDAVERAGAESHRSSTAQHRFRIEHAQIVAPQDMPRFKKLGVIASVQPTHCTSDMRWAAERLGEERLAGAYAWKSLSKAGAQLCGGSDFPVESQSPWLGIYAAVTRQTVGGEPPGGWRAQECLSREEAVRLFTTDAAYAGFAENTQGRLAAGFVADFVVIDRDVFECAAADIPKIKTLRTVVGGETVYSSD